MFFRRRQVVNCCRLAVNLRVGARVQFRRNQGATRVEDVYVNMTSDTGTGSANSYLLGNR
jgi:hypothetical protein